MRQQLWRKGIFLSLEFLGLFAGVFAFLVFFKSLSNQILDKALTTEGSLTTLLRWFFGGLKWTVISLFAIGLAYLVRRKKGGWSLKELGFRVHRNWRKDIWFGIVIFALQYIILLPVRIAVFPSKAKLAGEPFLKEMSQVSSPVYLLIPAVLFTVFVTFMCAFWEEVYWRGYLQNLFSRAMAPATGFFVSVLFFGLGHYFTRPEWGVLDVISALTGGVVLCLAFYATGSLLVVAVTHTLGNLWWEYPFVLYLKGSVKASYVFIGLFAIVLLVFCIVGRKEIAYFLQKTKELFVRSGWKMSFVGIFLGGIALCYMWMQGTLKTAYGKEVFLGVLIVFSIVSLGGSFAYKERKSTRTP